MNILRILIKYVDLSSNWSGKIVSWLIFFLILELAYDTVARYGFNAPTAWSYDISYMLYGALFMLGAAYTLLVDEHIRVEAFYERFSPRARAFIDLIGYLVFFFPSVGVLIYFGIDFAWESWKLRETSITFWAPPVYPLKVLIPIAAFLLLIQGVAKFIRNLVFIIKGIKF